MQRLDLADSMGVCGAKHALTPGSVKDVEREVSNAGDAGGTYISETPLRSEYTLGQPLGQGAYAVVYACSKVGSDNMDYVVKMVDKVETKVDDIEQEAKMLQDMAHPNVVRFHNIYYEKFFVCIVMDRCKGGDLIEAMQAYWKFNGQIPCNKVVHVSRQMCEAVRHLHEKEVVHRDVKGDNFLMDRKDFTDSRCKIILADFGAAVKLEKHCRLVEPVGTKMYWAPEIWQGNYGFKVDVWALGVIQFGLLVGRFPFRDQEETDNKVLRQPQFTPDPCWAYISSLLERKEDERWTAEEACASPWLKTIAGRQQASVEVNPHFKPGEDMMERGANAGVVARRAELVGRMAGTGEKQDKTVLRMLGGRCFEVYNKHTGKTLKYEWWTKKRFEGHKILEFKESKSESGIGMVSTQSIDLVGKMLNEHEIKTDKFGTGGAKSLKQFAAEVHNGAALLMLDAREHKKLVRVVDVVLLRISCDLGNQHVYLVESSEVRSDGHRVKDLNRLPGTKREPHENNRKTAERLISEELNLGDCQLRYDVNNPETFETAEDSPSYPGVRTLYRKNIIPVVLSSRDPNTLNRIGLGLLQTKREYRRIDRHSNTKEFVWLTDEECKIRKVALRASKEGEVSGLVHAPVGFDEGELRTYLHSHGVETSGFGHHGAVTIKDFSAELIKGLASLMLVAGPTKELIRVIDIVCLLLCKGDEVLVMSQETDASQKPKKLNLLPGTRRRPDENQFHTAQRILSRQLKLDGNYVELSAEDVRILEETKDLPTHPGLRTLTRKRVITAYLQLGGVNSPLPVRDVAVTM